MIMPTEAKTCFAHLNFNVLDLERSIAWYKQALGLHETARKQGSAGDRTLVYLSDNASPSFLLELTYMHDRKEPYEPVANNTHLAMRIRGCYEEMLRLHREMNCVVQENPRAGVYFIQDPDGNVIELLPENWA